MKKIIFLIIFLLLTKATLAASVFDDLREKKKTTYLDFVLLKIEQRLIQRHGLLGTQPMALRVQYQSILSQVNFSEEDSKIVISVIGVMDERRYKNKKYTPKVSDCNVLRNILLYGKYGYNIFQKRNKYLTDTRMEEIFLSRFLHNLSLTEKEKQYILDNTLGKIEIVDPVRGNDIFCTGKIAEELR